METKQVNLRVEDCFKLFDQSFTRVKYFSGIVSSIETSMLPNDWNIKSSSGISYTVAEPDEETTKQYLIDGCNHFVHRYLVRDIIESFMLCLDKVVLYLYLHGKPLDPDKSPRENLSKNEVKKLTNFEFKGLQKKIEFLKDEFGIAVPKEHEQCLESLRHIRNCFAHSNGMVRFDDGIKDGSENRIFEWFVLTVFLVGLESGERYELALGESIPEESKVCSKIETYSSAFKVGDSLSFTPAEVYEIAFSLQLSAHQYIKSVAEKLDS